MRPALYRAGVETALHGAGLPYGFTLTIWGTGHAISQHRGTPGLGLVLLFAAGAATAFGMLRVFSRGASAESGLQISASPRLIRAGVVHVTAIGAAISSGALAGNIEGFASWPVGGFAATFIYLAVAAIELGWREREEVLEDSGG